MNFEEKVDKSIKLSIIDLKCNGVEVIDIFKILRNSLEFIDKNDVTSTKQKV